MNVAELTIDYEPISETDGRSSRRVNEHDAVMRLIRRHFGTDAELLHDRDGAPSVEGFSGHISISHCRGLAALAIHPTMRIGIDIEQPRTQLAAVRHKYLTPAEAAALTTIDDMLWAWTAKEAVYKAAGTAGLSLTSIELSSDRTTATITSGTDQTTLFRLYSAFSNNIMVTVAIPA